MASHVRKYFTKTSNFCNSSPLPAGYMFQDCPVDGCLELWTEPNPINTMCFFLCIHNCDKIKFIN